MKRILDKIKADFEFDRLIEVNQKKAWKLEEVKKEIKNILAEHDCDLKGYITLYDIDTKEEIEFN